MKVHPSKQMFLLEIEYGTAQLHLFLTFLHQ